MKILKKCSTESVAASALKCRTSNKEIESSALATDDNDLHDEEAHFLKFSVSKMIGEKFAVAIEAYFRNRLEDGLSDNLDMFIYKCVSEILRNIGILHEKKIKNEAGVRFSYANPIVMMLCEAFNYSIEMEESAAQNMVTVSKNSKPDFICWRLINKSQKVVAVVMEVKLLYFAPGFSER